MQKITYIRNVVIITITMLNASFLQSMNEVLLLVPKEVFNHIFSRCLSPKNNQVQSLFESMKTLLKWRRVCQKFNNVLMFKAIGELCNNYTQETKNQVLKQLLEATHASNYATMRTPFLLVIHANADPNTKADRRLFSPFNEYLLETVIENNDEPLTRLLFEHNADPNIRTSITAIPLFFKIKNIEIARLFLAKKNLNKDTERDNTNILWYMTMNHKYPAELIKLYIENGVNAKQLYPFSNSCLLHECAEYSIPSIENVGNHIQITKTILEAIPGMINHENKYGETPLDFAYASLQRARKNNVSLTTIDMYDQLVNLYRQHGGKTAKELNPQKAVEKNQTVQTVQKKQKNTQCLLQ